MTMTTRTLILGSIFFLAAMTSAGETGRCYTADISSPIVLPNGDETEAGLLRICLRSKLSPVQGLHVTSMNGNQLGGFRSWFGTSEASDDGAFFVFTRGAEGRLILEGYAVSQGRQLRTYHLGRGRVTTGWSGLRAMNDERADQNPWVRIGAER